MKNSSLIFQGFVAVACWIFAWMVAHHFLFSGAEAVYVYSFITGWWFTAFTAAKLNLRAASAIVMFLVFLPMFAFTWVIDSWFFYREIRTLSAGVMVLIAAVQGMIFASPVVFNKAVDVVLKKIIR